jgi:hypothetical protein
MGRILGEKKREERRVKIALHEGGRGGEGGVSNCGANG